MTDDSTRPSPRKAPAPKPVPPRDHRQLPIKSIWRSCLHDYGHFSGQLSTKHYAVGLAIQRSWEDNGRNKKKVRKEETLAKNAGCSKSTVQRALKDLLEQGWLTYEPGVGRRPNRYYAAFPAWLILPPEQGGPAAITLREHPERGQEMAIYWHFSRSKEKTTSPFPADRIVYPAKNGDIREDVLTGEGEKLSPDWDFRSPEWLAKPRENARSRVKQKISASQVDHTTNRSRVKQVVRRKRSRVRLTT